MFYMKRQYTQDRVKSVSTDAVRRRRVALLAVPSVHTSALYGAFDILNAAGLRVEAGSSVVGQPALDAVIVAADRASVTGWNGVTVNPHCGIEEAGSVDAVFIPSLGDPTGTLPAAPAAMLHWLTRQYHLGVVIAAACSGVAVAAATGLLQGEKATTHWAFSAAFRQAFPEVHFEPERALVQSGEGQRIVTAGGGTMWMDLMLYLISRLLGQEAAVSASKLYMMDWSRDSQLPYACLQERLQHADALVRDAQQTMSRHLVEADALTRARHATGLAQRTFERRFQSAVGMSPLRYLQQLRIEYAKELLERTRLPADEVAASVGYSDPSSFRRLFSRLIGISPGQYRRRFRTPPDHGDWTSP
jgi:transcriptional regulator GlxA family with amidase domain